MNPKANIRKAAVAGQFYPGSPDILRATIEQLFAAAPSISAKETVRALIVPHAGYRYSGPTAAAAVACLDAGAEFDRIFLIGNSHQARFDGVAVADFDYFATPLGFVECDRPTTEKLRSNRSFSCTSDVHRAEHSLEVIIPLLQGRLRKPFRIVPLLLGTDDPRACRDAARGLEPWFNDRNLFVISTDLSHYPDAPTAVKTDARTAQLIAEGDPNQLHHWLQEVKQQHNNKLITAMCGAGAVMTLLNLCLTDRNLQITPVQYSHSGEADKHDQSRVVGYQSMVVMDEAERSPTSREKRWLLQLAWQSIENHFKKKTETPLENETSGSIGFQKMGAFVSVYVKGKLRGCIGRFEPGTSLRKLIPELAISAAFSDRRFEPVKSGDLPSLEIEISLLTPMRKIDRIEDFEPGKHGILIRKGLHSGTFLPQVAETTGWNREELLRRCSEQKAGLGPDGWKTAELFVYEAIIIRSDETLPQ